MEYVVFARIEAFLLGRRPYWVYSFYLRWTCDLQVAGSIPAGTLSRNISQLSRASLQVAKSSICIG